MKLSTRDAAAHFASPRETSPGTLIFGADPMRVALKRQELLAALVGPAGEDEMRLVRLAPADLRDEPTRISDEIKSQGFFPGPRAVLLDGATDAVAPRVAAALEDWAPGDAHLVVTAGGLAPRSALRKLFEAHPTALAAAVYDDPPGRGEIEHTLRSAGLKAIDREADTALEDIARALGPGAFGRLAEKIALYKLGDETPLIADEVAALAPASTEAALDEMLDVVADAEAHRIGPMLRRLESQGVTPVSLCIAATRHFRTLFAAAADPGGPGQGIARVRPPVFGPRRDRMRRQAQDWDAARLDAALQLLLDTDLGLRSSSRAPQMAVMERTLIRLAMMRRR